MSCVRNKEKSFIWIGSVVGSEKLQEMNSLGGRDTTACNVQRKFIDGLKELQVDVDSLTGYCVPLFPKYKKVFLEGNHRKEVTGKKHIETPMLNLPLFSRPSKAFFLIIEAIKWTIKNKNREKIVYIYSLHTPFLIAGTMIKMLGRSTTIISIIPDLPENMDANMSRLKAKLKRIDRKFICLIIRKYIDGVALFAEPMKKYLPLENKKISIVEGILSFDRERYERVLKETENNTKKIVMCSGTLNQENGIHVLLQAFSHILEENYELWLTGVADEDTQKLIDEFCNRDSRIKFFGYLSSYQELLDLQRQASLFVSMALPTSKKASTFFPSKIMEYLLTGAPVLSFRLEAIPIEYNQVLYFLEDAEPEHIAQRVIEVCNLTEDEKRRNNKKRIELLSSKDKKQQAYKLLCLAE